METQWTRMTANEAAEIIQHNDMVAFSGFTPAGSPKALPTAIARRANEQHEAKKPYQIRLLTGASISAAADDVLSDADAVSWRVWGGDRFCTVKNLGKNAGKADE